VEAYKTLARKRPLGFSSGARTAHLSENGVRLAETDDDAANQHRYSTALATSSVCWQRAVDRLRSLKLRLLLKGNDNGFSLFIIVIFGFDRLSIHCF